MRKELVKGLSALMTAGMVFGAAAAVPAEESSADSELETVTCFINESWYPVTSFTGKIPDEIKKRTGVDLDVTIATDSTQLGVMIASGDLPDIIFTDTYLNELSDPNICYSLDELDENYGADYKDAENYDIRNGIAQTLSSDGKAYTLLNYFNTNEQWAYLQIGAPGQACIYYRKDLLDKAGIEVPTDLGSLHQCLLDVKEAYPDMTPLGMGGVWKAQVLGIWSGVNAGVYDGTNYKYTATTDNYKSFLQYCNSLYRDGLISAEDYANENEETGHQKAYNDGCVFYTWYLSSSNLNQLRSNSVSKDADWTLLKPCGEATIGTGKGWAGAFVSKNASNPEAAAKIVSFLNTPEGCALSRWGVEGEDYTLDDKGVPQFSEEYLAAREDSQKWYSEINTMFYFGASAVTELYMNYSGMDPDELDLFNAYGEGYKNYPEVGIAQPSTTSDEGVVYSKLEELRKDYEARVIFTDSDDAFESAYSEYMSALDKTGVEDYNDYMTKKIAEVKEQFGL